MNTSLFSASVGTLSQPAIVAGMGTTTGREIVPLEAGKKLVLNSAGRASVLSFDVEASPVSSSVLSSNNCNSGLCLLSLLQVQDSPVLAACAFLTLKPGRVTLSCKDVV